jgi:protein-S-isoprenylcysteine O-methyltransferase Ste14
MPTMRLQTLKQLVPIFFSLAVPSLCLFGSSGQLCWSNAWILLGLYFGASITNTVLLWRDSALRAERRNTKAGKSWDKPIVFIVVLLGPSATWITAGMDIRFHWSAGMSSLAVIAGVIVAVLAAALIAWAMRSNTFFSSIVRIQKDRGHIVVSSGPYRFVRHPGYSGIFVFTLVTPLILNSRWAFVPAVVTAVATVLRTILEDRTLQQELDGYADYAHRVRYKLIPDLW